MGAIVPDLPQRPSGHRDAHRATRRDRDFLKQVARRETDQSERIAAPPQYWQRAPGSPRRPVQSLLFEPVTHRNRTDDDLVRTELFLKMRSKVHHQRATVERRSALRLADDLDMLACNRVRDAVCLSPQHARIRESDSLNFARENFEPADIEHFARSSDDLDEPVLFLDDVAGV